MLIDADNAQLGKVPLVIEELSSRGHVVIKRAYGDWSVDTLKNWKTKLNELAIQPVQQFAYTKGKNATDASMIIDAMDLLYSRKFDAFALISSDSDFTKLASRLREDEIYVFGVGENKTPISFRSAWDQVQDDQGWAPLSGSGSFLKRAKPDFDPRTYGAKKFSDLFADLEKYFDVQKGGNGGGIKAYRPKDQK